MVESLAIESFRGIQKADISGLTSVSVLVGPNGSGKTTVMEAIHIVCQPLAGLMRALGGSLRQANDSQWLTLQGRRDAALSLSFAAHGVRWTSRALNPSKFRFSRMAGPNMT
ncbi:AAA family ATPase [bacterium]|nr:AAA family ATPase [bacterium]